MVGKTLRALGFAGALALVPAAALAQVGGNLAAPPAEPLTIEISGAGPTLSQTMFELVTGDYYRLTLTSDGAGEFMFRAPDLLSNSHLRLVVINDVEVHLEGMSFQGIEFDGAGTAAFSFVPIRPGEYTFTIGDVSGTFVVR